MKPHLRFKLLGLTPELFLVVVLPLSALLLVVTFGGVALHQQAMREMVGERDQRAAQAAAQALSEQLYHRLIVMQGLAQDAGPAMDPTRLLEILVGASFLSQDFDGGLAFFDPQGKLLTASSGSQAVNAPLDQGWMPAPGEVTLSPVYPAAAGTMMFAAARNPISGIVAIGAFSPGRMSEHLLTDIVNPAEGGVVFLVDAQKQVIYHTGLSLDVGELQAHPGIAEALAGRSGSFFIGNHQHVTAYSPVDRSGWALVIEEPWHSVSSPTLRLTEYAPLVLLPVVIVSMLALWFGTNRIVRPLKALQARAVRLGWGDYDAIRQPVGGIIEIRQLQDELAHLARKVQSAQQGLRDYISAMTAGQEDERRRLARELHDDTLQALIALKQRVQLLRMRLDLYAGHATSGNGHADSNAAPGDDVMGGLVADVDSLQVLAEETIQNLRRLTRALRPIYLEDLGLVTALEMLAVEMSRPDLGITFCCTGKVDRLSPSVELALYRMTQEALSNVRRHANASQAKVVVVFEDALLCLQVSDNGQGFTPPISPAAFVHEGHFGLLGLHERSEMIGARLEIHSQPGEGTRVSISLPRPVEQPIEA